MLKIDMSELIEIGKKLELVNSYAKLGRDYGLFTKKISVPHPGDGPKEYLVFSLDPIKDNFDPVEVINRNKRNHNLFYPRDFAVEVGSENPLLMWDRISNYLAYAEFMYDVYSQFNVTLPEAIRTDELKALANFYSKYQDPAFDEETRMGYLEGLQDFFSNEKEKTKSGFKQEWHKFYRSELFDGKKSFLHNFLTFMKRHEPETSLNTLIESNGELKKVYMAEHHYKRFREIIKERYPAVKYSVGEKEVVDEGMLSDPQSGLRVETPYGITVTDEEYDRIMEERFDAEGHACLDGLNVSLSEGRDVIYKASDENIIASVSHEASLTWAKCCDVKTLEGFGSLASVEIPMGQVTNFYVGMKDHNVPFCFDYGVNSSPNFKTLRVLYNVQNENVVQNLLIGLTIIQLNLAHISLDNQDVRFDLDLKKIDNLIKQASERVLENPDSGVVGLLSDKSKDLDV